MGELFLLVGKDIVVLGKNDERCTTITICINICGFRDMYVPWRVGMLADRKHTLDLITLSIHCKTDKDTKHECSKHGFFQYTRTTTFNKPEHLIQNATNASPPT